MSAYSKNPDVVFRTIADEFILVPIRQKVVDLKSIFTLNPVAAFIWENINGKNDAAAIKSRISESFEVSSSECDPDVDGILSQLESLGLIQKR